MKINWFSKHFWFLLTFTSVLSKYVTGVIPFGKNNILEGKLLVIPSHKRRKFAPFLVEKLKIT